MHDLSPIPDAGWLTVRDRDEDRFFTLEAAGSASEYGGPPIPDFSAHVREWISLHGRLYECPECGRLLWKRPGEAEYRSYRPEPPAS